ncbi:PREDICTED: ubinuclein-1-like isoform X4 [Brassica oleracea var. oleracea]|uniref:ubinuclein-1-like isoform X4 n=1 Tax=Brassica oleracea var. oleracea TaxID=109376 RepID=UPI0006A6CF79|nr:PREDICTED: ubinuclein-1-like isoform X4 [Brassica oleracea var. oleracea]
MGEHKAATDGESSRTSPKLLAAADRKLLKVELRRGETTYVSWKKLMKEASKGHGSSAPDPDSVPNANPNLEAHLAPGPPAEGEMVDQPHSNRFNAVIEKIERLYMGRDSSDGEELDGAPDDDEYDTEDSFIDDVELDEYFEVDDAKIKHDGFFVNKGKLEQIEPSTATMSNQKPKKRQRKESAKPPGDVVDVSRKQAKIAKTDGGRDQSAASGPSLKKKISDSKTVQDSVSPLKPQSGNDLENVKHSDKANLLRNALSPRSKAAESSGALHMKHSNKGAHQLSNSLPGKSGPDVLAKSTVVRQKENTDNAILSRQSIQRKGGSNARPKTSTLEKAFRELEKVVAESRPPAAATENQDADTSSSQAVKRRLPGDVKSKLAKVARIAASQGNVSGELINRLMSIVGHLIQVRSLKRNLKIMIDSGDSANREKDNKFQRIKNEVVEMLKTQVPLIESQATNQEAGTSDDFQDVGPPTKKKFVMDAAMEDKLCDLYDIFVDGLDEDSGPHIRKLYANLAELWPNRLMDNHGIKRAICRAKERRRALYENHGKDVGQGKMTKRKQTLPKPEGTTAYPEKASSVGDKTTGVVVPSATTTSLDTTQPTVDKSKQQHEKLKGSSSSSAEAKAARKKTEKAVEVSHLATEKAIVLALKQQTQAPPDLNLPS